VAQKAGVKRLVISYHHPDDDDFLDHVQTEIQSVFPKALLAREGLILSIN
jgi:ribonuclease BN (tRNA processing enzyme)